MLASWPVAMAVGTFLGFLSGLGIGGGSLLILWLTMMLDIPQEIARGINLLFFLPSAIVSIFFRWKQGTVKIRTFFPAIAVGCLSAAALSILSFGMDMQLLKKLFGGLLVVTGLRELLYKPKAKK